jgi:hypothetical protein
MKRSVLHLCAARQDNPVAIQARGRIYTAVLAPLWRGSEDKSQSMQAPATPKRGAGGYSPPATPLTTPDRQGKWKKEPQPAKTPLTAEESETHGTEVARRMRAEKMAESALAAHAQHLVGINTFTFLSGQHEEGSVDGRAYAQSVALAAAMAAEAQDGDRVIDVDAMVDQFVGVWKAEAQEKAIAAMRRKLVALQLAEDREARADERKPVQPLVLYQNSGMDADVATLMKHFEVKFGAGDHGPGYVALTAQVHVVYTVEGTAGTRQKWLNPALLRSTVPRDRQLEPGDEVQVHSESAKKWVDAKVSQTNYPEGGPYVAMQPAGFDYHGKTVSDLHQALTALPAAVFERHADDPASATFVVADSLKRAVPHVLGFMKDSAPAPGDAPFDSDKFVASLGSAVTQTLAVRACHPVRRARATLTPCAACAAGLAAVLERAGASPPAHCKCRRVARPPRDFGARVHDHQRSRRRRCVLAERPRSHGRTAQTVAERRGAGAPQQRPDVRDCPRPGEPGHTSHLSN